MKKAFSLFWWYFRYLPFFFMIKTWLMAFYIGLFYCYALRESGQDFHHVLPFLLIFGSCLPFSYYALYVFLHRERRQQSHVIVVAPINGTFYAIKDMFRLCWQVTEYVLAYVLGPVLAMYMFRKIYLEYLE